ncbi:MAG: MFS transporter [Nitriliruptorales bacterium]|nr:MFS transporter [Nitriliruptorales bacterium]
MIASGRLRRFTGGLNDRWALLSLATLAYWVGTQALRPMVVLRLEQLGASDAAIGLIIGAYSFSSFLLAVPSGRVVDRVGLWHALQGSQVAMAVAGVGFATAAHVAWLTAVLLAAGVAELGVWLALQALASHAGTGERLRRRLAVFSFAWGAGLAVGPMVGSTLFDRAGFAAVGWVYAVGALVGLVASFWVPYRHGGHLGQEPVPLRQAVRSMWTQPVLRGVLLSSFVTLYIYGVRNSFYPLFLQRAGVSVPRIGLLLSILGLASLLIRLPLPLLLRRVGTERLLVAAMWVSVAAMTVTPWLGTIWLWAPAAAVAGFGLGINPPVTVELMARHTGLAERGLAMGLRVTSNRLAQAIQPVVFGTVAAVVGLASAFAVSGVFIAGITGWAARETQRGRSRQVNAAPPDP